MSYYQRLLEARKQRQELDYLTDPVEPVSGEDIPLPNTPKTPKSSKSPKSPSNDYDNSYHNGLFGNKIPTVTSSPKPLAKFKKSTGTNNGVDINLLNSRTYQNTDKKSTRTNQSADLNLLSGRKYQQQSDMDRQKISSRLQDKQNYMKIKSFVKPHLDRVVRKVVNRNYWSKDIKPGLETIANAFRR